MSLQLVLERDGHDQAWGFRLQGGSDVGLPLSIQRVLVGTPSESVLRRGDLVVKIGTIGTHSLTHQQAVDLFSAAGNSCAVTVKRAMTGAPQTPPSAQPTVSSLQATAAARQQKQQEAPESPQVAALPRTTFVRKSELPLIAPIKEENPNSLSVKKQPYRTLPLVHPSIKVLPGVEVGTGSHQHLRYQEEVCTGVKEVQLFPVSPAQAKQIKANEIILKRKTQEGLVNAASDHQKLLNNPAPTSGPIPGPTPLKLPSSPVPKPSSPAIQPAKYNSAGGLYANQSTGYLKKPAGMVNPSGTTLLASRVISSAATPAGKNYNPSESETYKLLFESEKPLVERSRPFITNMSEHTPIYSEVYAAPKQAAPGHRPVRQVAPSKIGSPRIIQGGVNSSPAYVLPDGSVSHVAAAAIADKSSSPSGRPAKNEPIPLYETNSITGHRRIAQSSSFNKLMMSVMGE